MVKISVVIITYNEQDNIERCIQSVKSLADEIVVVDSFSTDNTEEICSNLGVKFYKHAFEGYREQKNYALKLAQSDYILSLDGDEALSEELCKSIQNVKNRWEYDAYYSNRLSNYCGQWIKHSNWYPDKKIRLFDRRKGRWGGYNLHETVQMDKDAIVSFLNGDILHWVHKTYDEHIEKANQFSTIGAIEYYNAGRKSIFFSAPYHMIWRFFKAYFLRKGFLDGFNGFVICSISAFTSFLKYVKLRQLILNERNKQKRNDKNKEVKIAQ